MAGSRLDFTPCGELIWALMRDLRAIKNPLFWRGLVCNLLGYRYPEGINKESDDDLLSQA